MGPTAFAGLSLWPANSLFVEGYLTTRGDAVGDTYRMIREAGFEVEGNDLSNTEGIQEQAQEGFRLAGRDGDILKPSIRSDA